MLNEIQKRARNYRQANKKTLLEEDNNNLMKRFKEVIKSIVVILRQYRNVITARESRIKKKKEPVNLEK